MDWKTLSAVLLLLLLAPHPRVAAAATGDCLGNRDTGQALPLPLDLAGRPSATSGLAAHTFASEPAAEADKGCQSPLPSASQSATAHGEAADVLHGLPAPDILDPLAEPKSTPQSQ